MIIDLETGVVHYSQMAQYEGMNVTGKVLDMMTITTKQENCFFLGLSVSVVLHLRFILRLFSCILHGIYCFFMPFFYPNYS